MNIDAFLDSFHAELLRFSGLVAKLTDIMVNRIQRNLAAVEQLRLVDLPEHESMTLDRFVATQEKRVKEQSAHLLSKNLEVEELVVVVAV